MDRLQRHRDYLEDEWRAAQAAPLSARKAMLVAMLIDAYVDRLFAAAPEAEDILEFRADQAQRSCALGMVLELCSSRSSLAMDTVEISIGAYTALPIEDFMVSVYSGHSVLRLRLVTANGGRHDMQDILREAILALSEGTKSSSVPEAGGG